MFYFLTRRNLSAQKLIQQKDRVNSLNTSPIGVQKSAKSVFVMLIQGKKYVLRTDSYTPFWNPFEMGDIQVLSFQF